jgi:pyruvate dehydrogenase E2 component (dihydrolipoamide acetyltransferase)
MSESKRSKPCFYVEAKADVTELMGLRPKLGKSLGVKITSNAFFIRALALAVRKYPLMVGVLRGVDCGDEIGIPEAINIGFAVNAPQGLVVPVVKDADKKGLAEIARIEKLLTEKARGNKLTLEDMEGETIALSNLGAYGIDSFVGIVPPPASTILAVGNVVKTVTPASGGPTVRKWTHGAEDNQFDLIGRPQDYRLYLRGGVSESYQRAIGKPTTISLKERIATALF